MHSSVNGGVNMSRKKPTLSAIVIAKNEQDRLEICLKALLFAGEILVVDNGSDDGTATIAQKFGAQVVRSNSSSFAELHNLGAKLAAHDWLLYVDADEVVSEELKKSILTAVYGTKQAYRLQRKNNYLGKHWPKIEYLVRLIKRDALVGWRGILHETAQVKGDIGDLHGYLVHDTHRTLEEMVAKTNIWSQTEARLRFDAGHPRVVPWRLLRVFLTGFWKSYIREGGWKVGTVGFIESLYQGFSLFITYAKLWEMQQNNKVTKTTN